MILYSDLFQASCQLPPDKFPPKEDPKQKTGQADAKDITAGYEVIT